MKRNQVHRSIKLEDVLSASQFTGVFSVTTQSNIADDALNRLMNGVCVERSDRTSCLAAGHMCR